MSPKARDRRHQCARTGSRDWGRVTTEEESVGEQTPRSEVNASLRDLIVGSKRLPWTLVILSQRSVNVQRDSDWTGPRSARLVSGIVFSKAVNARSGRCIPRRAIAVALANSRLGVGANGGRDSFIAVASMVKRCVASRRGGVACAGATVTPAPLSAALPAPRALPQSLLTPPALPASALRATIPPLRPLPSKP